MMCIDCDSEELLPKLRRCRSCNNKRVWQLAKIRIKVFGSKAWANERRTHLKKRAKLKGLTFSLTTDDVRSLYSTSICVYCENSITKPSMDRIDNCKGYDLSNCIVVCLSCNRAKSSLNKTLLKNIYLTLYGDIKPSDI